MTSQQRVLIVDDDPGALNALAELLRDEGFEVMTALNGQLALAAAPDFRPELVLIDLQMPVMDGLELLRRLRAGGLLAVPMIMTANGSEAVRQRAERLGAVEFLEKPLDIADVVGKIHRALAPGESFPVRPVGLPGKRRF